MTHQDWTDKLRDRMADYKAAAPEGLWADIESSLPQQKAKTRPLWPRWMSAAAIIALTAGIGWWLWPTNGEQGHDVTATIRQQVRQPLEPQQPDVEPEHLTAQAVVATVAQPQVSSHSEDSVLSEDVTTEPVSPATEQKAEEQTVSSQKEAQPQYQPHEPLSVRPEPEQSIVPRSSSRHHQDRVSVGIHANNGLMAYSHSNGVQMSAELASRYDYSGYLPTRSQQEVIWLAGYEERQHHDHPISYGLTVSYQLTPRWSLQTGLVYTRLHSEMMNIIKDTRINSEQTLYYLGIPLNIQYLLRKSRQWKVYVSGGAEVDWNVRADSKTEGVKTQIKKDQTQWSLGAAVGVEYDIIPQLGIYAEPGLRYYFDNGSKVQNFFKDQPTNWSLQLGIRLNIK